jgi:hypothetical protein
MRYLSRSIGWPAVAGIVLLTAAAASASTAPAPVQAPFVAEAPAPMETPGEPADALSGVSTGLTVQRQLDASSSPVHSFQEYRSSGDPDLGTFPGQTKPGGGSAPTLKDSWHGDHLVIGTGTLIVILLILILVT